MDKEAPEIIDKILAFINSFNNPDDSTEEYKSIKLFQMNVYDVSMNFAFKWYILKEEFKQVAQFIDEDISDNKKILYLSIGQYSVELEIKEIK